MIRIKTLTQRHLDKHLRGVPAGTADANSDYSDRRLMQKAIKYVAMSFVFVVAITVVSMGVNWASTGFEKLFTYKHNALKADLEASIHNSFTEVAPSASAKQENSAQEATALPMLTGPPLVSPSPSNFIKKPPQEPLAQMSVKITPEEQTVLVKKNEEKKLPIASLTKLMTALVVLENIDLNQQVIITKEAVAQEGEQGGLKLGQVLSVRALLYIMLIDSSNRAAYQLAEVLGIDQFIVTMNVEAQKLGLYNTRFSDATGLDKDSYSTAADLVKLSRYLFEKYPLFKEIIGLKEYSLYLSDGTFHHTLKNTNQLLGSRHIIGGKTGFTEAALGCFMVFQTPNESEPEKYVINIILGSEDRFGDMEKLIQNHSN